jgi:chromosome segregation ATPase
MNSILDKNKEISNKIMMFEEEFIEKINNLEKNYSVNIVKITQQKTELEKKLKLKEDQINEINEEFQTLKHSYQAKSTALDELTNMVESSRTNLTTYDNNIKIIIDENMRLNTIVNQISTKAEDYDTLKSENETLREKINEFDKNFKLFEKKKEENNSKLLKELEKKYRELEKNYNNIKEQNENLKSLMFILDSNLRKKLER